MGPGIYHVKVQHLFFKNGERSPQIVNALGLAGEAAEVLEVFDSGFADFADGVHTDESIAEYIDKMQLEMGDVLWYVAALADSLGFTLKDIDNYIGDNAEESLVLFNQLNAMDPLRLIGFLNMHAGKVADIIKKNYWHGKPLDADGIMGALTNIICVLVTASSRQGFDIGVVAQRNIEKLAKRYPGGFVEGGGIQ